MSSPWIPRCPTSPTEAFSLIRYSALDRAAYIDLFFDTGRERQG